MEGIRLCQLLGIIREGGACFTIRDEDGRKYCDEYRGGIAWMMQEPWYGAIRERQVSKIITLGGGDGLPVETCITLTGKKPWEDRNRRTTFRKLVPAQTRQDRMDEIPIGFCEHLNIVNGFITEIIAGHITRIGREADLARMPPEKGKTGILTKQ